jgi:hypothetical protein
MHTVHYCYETAVWKLKRFNLSVFTTFAAYIVPFDKVNSYELFDISKDRLCG